MARSRSSWAQAALDVTTIPLNGEEHGPNQTLGSLTPCPCANTQHADGDGDEVSNTGDNSVRGRNCGKHFNHGTSFNRQHARKSRKNVGSRSRPAPPRSWPYPVCHHLSAPQFPYKEANRNKHVSKHKTPSTDMYIKLTGSRVCVSPE